RLWPKPESLIVVYAFFVSLSIPALYLFLKELQLNRGTMLALLAAWLSYPLQQKVAFYSYCDPLSYCGTFYFIYLFLLRRNSPFAVLGCLGMFLLREETFFLVPATVFLLPQKWKTLLWHFACMVPLVIFARHGASNPLAYASVSFNPAFITNFILTQTILWVLALVNAPALLVAAGFLVAVICVGGEIFFQFPQAFVGASFSSPGPYYYYGLLTPILLAAVALGMARLNANQKRLAQMCLALLIVPGIAYAACQLRILGQPDKEARQIRAFAAASVPPDAAVVTDLGLPAYFANRNELYVYRDPPKGVTLPEIFARAKFAFIFRPDLPKIKAAFLDASPQHWRLALELPDYAIYRAD
ncbi:MAG TPA: hypothetical protein VFC07_11620, partial [Verrucomicrobiae bacterium]|nr:hypothetical protein [Verrucomicrobiae bacterium]